MGIAATTFTIGSSGCLGMSFIEMIVMMVLAIPLVAIIGGTLVAIVKVVTGGGRSSSGAAADEAKLIQELHDGLMRMEERVDALETLLLDRERNEKRESRR